jgi:hypothetical protein
MSNKGNLRAVTKRLATPARGPAGGISLDYSFSLATADADPGSGFLDLNNGAASSATKVFLNDQDAHGAAVGTFLGSFAIVSAVVNAKIRIQAYADPTRFLTADMSGGSSSVGYHKLNISNVFTTVGGTFAQGESLFISFDAISPVGSAGGALQGSYPNPDLNAMWYDKRAPRWK